VAPAWFWPVGPVICVVGVVAAFVDAAVGFVEITNKPGASWSFWPRSIRGRGARRERPSSTRTGRGSLRTLEGGSRCQCRRRLPI
jgi:hypothetical protein